MSDNLPLPDTLIERNGCNSTSIQPEETDDLKELLKVQDKFIRCRILYDALEECATSFSCLDQDLQFKVQDILLESSCKQVTGLNTEAFSVGSSVLLGLTASNEQISYSKSAILRKTVTDKLQEKYRNICDHFLKVTGENISTVPSELDDKSLSNISREDSALLELRTKLKEQQRNYLQHLLEEQIILEDIVKLRLENLPEICSNKIKECKVKSVICDLQSKIVEEKMRVDIFMETNNSLAAYKNLINDLKEQQQECNQEIQHLRKLKEKYKQVACKQFEEILRSFVQYKSSLAKKKLMIESLQS